MTQFTGRRTTLRAGREVDYERIHATVPAAVASALRAAGVLDWHIWRDGVHLFHAIETEHGYDAMVEAISAIPPVDPPWDQVIASLLEPAPAADVLLSEVWSLSGSNPADPSVTTGD